LSGRSPKDVRELIIEQQRIEREVERLAQEVALIDRSIGDAEGALSALEAIKKGEAKEDDLLFPVGGGIFLRGKLSEKERVVVNVGSNVFLTKGIEEAINLLKERLNLLNRAKTERVQALSTLRRRYDEIAAILAEERVKAGK